MEIALIMIGIALALTLGGLLHQREERLKAEAKGEFYLAGLKQSQDMVKLAESEARDAREITDAANSLLKASKQYNADLEAEIQNLHQLHENDRKALQHALEGADAADNLQETIEALNERDEERVSKIRRVTAMANAYAEQVHNLTEKLRVARAELRAAKKPKAKAKKK